MTSRIIEICELGFPKSIIHRENEPITEIIDTDVLIEELNMQLSITDVVWQSEQLKVFVNGFYEWHAQQCYVSVKMQDWDDYIATLL